ncbi:uncharacterized protein LOC109972788 [Tachysurus ichikawai]
MNLNLCLCNHFSPQKKHPTRLERYTQLTSAALKRKSSTEDEKEESFEGVEFVDAGALLDEDDYLEYQLTKHHRCACPLLNLVSTVDASKAEVNPLYKRMSGSTFAKCSSLWNKSEGAFAALCSELDTPKFTPVELAFLAEYAKTMSPVAKALDVLQGETSVQMGWLVPTIHHTITLLRTKLRPLHVTSKFCLEKCFGEMLADQELIAAAILVPKFKTCWTSDKNIFKLGLDYIRNYLDCQAENHITACERLFSVAGLIFRPRRACIGSKNFENQLLLWLNKAYW